ncbi:MAG: zinc transporter ZntB [Pseudohongiellaceae bacterium]
MTTRITLLHALAFNGEGGASPIEDENLVKMLSSDTLTWVHLDASESNASSWFTNHATELDGLIVEALLAEETRPRLLEHEDGVLLILRGVNLNLNAAPEDMVSIRLWVDANRIISVRLRKLKAVSDIVENLKIGKGPTNSGDFIAELSRRLFDRMEPVFSSLDEELDDLEENVMESPDTCLRSGITQIRKQSIIFHRYISPQKEVISSLLLSKQPWLSQLQRRDLQETLDKIIRYLEDIEMVRERAHIIKDELTNALSEKINRNLYFFSVIAAIFLPLGFLTGLLGVNLGGLPGADNPAGFIIFSSILMGVVTLQIALFKWLKWF